MKTIPVLIPSAVPELIERRVTETFAAALPWRDAETSAAFDARRSSIRGVAASAGYGRFDAAFMDRLPALEIIASYGVGHDHIDLTAAAARGITVTNTPGVLDAEVADLALALLLATARMIPNADRFVRSGDWAGARFPLMHSLSGRRVGILGLGRIGKQIARRCEAFGLSVAWHGRSAQPDVKWPRHDSPRELAAAVDFLIVVLPGAASTRHIVDAEVLAALGPEGTLINVARGSVVDEDALIAALQSGGLRAAGLDVFENEPRIRPEFSALDNTVLLPHVGSATIETRNAMGNLVVDNLISWFAGRGALTPVSA